MLTDHVRKLDPALEDSWREWVQDELETEGAPYDHKRRDPGT